MGSVVIKAPKGLKAVDLVKRAGELPEGSNRGTSSTTSFTA